MLDEDASVRVRSFPLELPTRSLARPDAEAAIREAMDGSSAFRGGDEVSFPLPVPDGRSILYF